MSELQTGSFFTARSHNLHNTRRYSIKWALTTVDRLEKKYPRATELAKRVWNVTTEQCAIFLSYNHPWWRIYRYTWKPLTSPTTGDEAALRFTVEQWRQVVLDHLEGNYSDHYDDFTKKAWIERLTALQNGLTIQEPV